MKLIVIIDLEHNNINLTYHIVYLINERDGAGLLLHDG